MTFHDGYFFTLFWDLSIRLEGWGGRVTTKFLTDFLKPLELFPLWSRSLRQSRGFGFELFMETRKLKAFKHSCLTALYDERSSKVVLEKIQSAAWKKKSCME